DDVVGVDDAAHEAEYRAGDQQPAAPQHRGRPDAVGPRAPPADPQQRDQRHQRGRQQPADLAAELTLEQPDHAGWAAPDRAAPTASSAAADRAGLVPG